MGACHVGRPPDRLLIDANGDDGPRKLFYDGKTVVLALDAAGSIYATLPVPDTITMMGEDCLSPAGGATVRSAAHAERGQSGRRAEEQKGRRVMGFVEDGRSHRFFLPANLLRWNLGVGGGLVNLTKR